MTGVEIVLLLAGCTFMVGSFFITEKLSPSELNKIAELSQDELRRIVDNEIKAAGSRIEDAVDNQIDASSDLVQRALEKETNQKIMAISDFSDTVIENMNKTHNEIVFLYSMLNDKHTELTSMTSDLQRLAADIRNLQENAAGVLAENAAAIIKAMPKKAAGTASPAKKKVEQPRETSAVLPTENQESAGSALRMPEDVYGQAQQKSSDEEDADNHNREILRMSKEGFSEVEIARKLGLGIGEVKLVIGLYRGEIDL